MKIIAPTMTDLITKVFRRENWMHHVGGNKTKRVLEHYEVKADQKANRYVAVRKQVRKQVCQ